MASGSRIVPAGVCSTRRAAARMSGVAPRMEAEEVAGGEPGDQQHRQVAAQVVQRVPVPQRAAAEHDGEVRQAVVPEYREQHQGDRQQIDVGQGAEFFQVRGQQHPCELLKDDQYEVEHAPGDEVPRRAVP